MKEGIGEKLQILINNQITHEQETSNNKEKESSIIWE